MDEYLVQPLVDLVNLFEARQIPYVLMGGLAVAAHGIPRPTHDIDFTIQIDRTDLPALFSATEELGYAVPESYSTGWVDQVGGMPLVRVRQWLSGKFVDIDIFLAESEFQRQLIRRRVQVELEGVPAWLVSAEDLILLKLIAGRPRDIGDIYDILLAQGELDDVYLGQWANKLGVAERLKKVSEDFNQDFSGETT